MAAAAARQAQALWLHSQARLALLTSRLKLARTLRIAQLKSRQGGRAGGCCRRCLAEGRGSPAPPQQAAGSTQQHTMQSGAQWGCWLLAWLQGSLR